jgi:hypothetical protein
MKDIFEMARQAGLVGGPVYARGLKRFAALVIANHPPQSYMTWQEGCEAGKQAERRACLADVRKVFSTFDNLPESAEKKMLKSLTLIFMESSEEEIELRVKS